MVVVSVSVLGLLMIGLVNGLKPVVGVLGAEVFDADMSEVKGTVVAGTKLSILSETGIPDYEGGLVLLGITTPAGEQGLVVHPCVCSARELQRRQRAGAIPSLIMLVSTPPWGDAALYIRPLSASTIGGSESSSECTVNASVGDAFWFDPSIEGQTVTIEAYPNRSESAIADGQGDHQLVSREITCDPRLLYAIKKDGRILKSPVWRPSVKPVVRKRRVSE